MFSTRRCAVAARHILRVQPVSSRSLSKLAGGERATALSSLSSAWLDLASAQPDQVSATALTGATAGRDAINRTFVFDDFKSAFGFMASAALHAEQVRAQNWLHHMIIVHVHALLLSASLSWCHSLTHLLDTPTTIYCRMATIRNGSTCTTEWKWCSPHTTAVVCPKR
mgnify:CR=1 FL=1